MAAHSYIPHLLKQLKGPGNSELYSCQLMSSQLAKKQNAVVQMHFAKSVQDMVSCLPHIIFINNYIHFFLLFDQNRGKNRQEENQCLLHLSPTLISILGYNCSTPGLKIILSQLIVVIVPKEEGWTFFILRRIQVTDTVKVSVTVTALLPLSGDKSWLIIQLFVKLIVARCTL